MFWPHSFQGGEGTNKGRLSTGNRRNPQRVPSRGRLSEILTPEDYQPIQNVGNSFTLLMVLGCLLE